MPERLAPGDARGDLMLPFGPLADRAGRDVVLSEKDADAALAYCRAMGSKLGAPAYLRYIFGMPVHEALLAGYQLTQRGLREAAPHACAQEIARTAMEFVSCLETDPDTADRRVLDIFAGVGQMVYSYAKAGCHVLAVDNDRTTVGVGLHNMALAHLASVVEYRLGDGPATLTSAVKADRRVSVVNLDPPWRGEYQYDLARPFLLESLAFDMHELVALGLAAADLVVLKLPHNAAPSEIRDLARLAGCSAFIQHLHISNLPDFFGLAPVYFFGQSGTGSGETASFQEQHLRLTVDGQRVG